MRSVLIRNLPIDDRASMPRLMTAAKIDVCDAAPTAPLGEVGILQAIDRSSRTPLNGFAEISRLNGEILSHN
jgi:hypothetical protein